jgi:hypothetical protein
VIFDEDNANLYEDADGNGILDTGELASGPVDTVKINKLNFLWDSTPFFKRNDRLPGVDPKGV